jgi:hypothetical protein
MRNSSSRDSYFSHAGGTFSGTSDPYMNCGIESEASRSSVPWALRNARTIWIGRVRENNTMVDRVQITRLDDSIPRWQIRDVKVSTSQLRYALRATRIRRTDSRSGQAKAGSTNVHRPLSGWSIDSDLPEALEEFSATRPY